MKRKRNNSRRDRFLKNREDDILYWQGIVQYDSLTASIKTPVKVNQITPFSLIADDVFQFSSEYLYDE